mmetsp:Transcript_42357/g.91935  ORF Transcript_42357/g.91935 Transcript_42357/m.91935 type:complete len:158 (+) Transcript_42357:64-537(+)
MSAFMNFLVASVDSMLTMNSPTRTGAKESGLSTEQTMEPPPRPKDMATVAQVMTEFKVSGGTILEQRLRPKARTKPMEIKTNTRPMEFKEIFTVGCSSSKLNKKPQLTHAKTVAPIKPFTSLKDRQRSSFPKVRLKIPEMNINAATKQALLAIDQDM